MHRIFPFSLHLDSFGKFTHAPNLFTVTRDRNLQRPSRETRSSGRRSTIVRAVPGVPRVAQEIQSRINSNHSHNNGHYHLPVPGTLEAIQNVRFRLNRNYLIPYSGSRFTIDSFSTALRSTTELFFISSLPIFLRQYMCNVLKDPRNATSNYSASFNMGCPIPTPGQQHSTPEVNIPLLTIKEHRATVPTALKCPPRLSDSINVSRNRKNTRDLGPIRYAYPRSPTILPRTSFNDDEDRLGLRDP
ncbi:uncharacterized protein BJX67DRAFT_25706 [Aspergillus lucknowensis]|uniref:Uncharacterized protein n=1 Tax=Aspergillus lucknowensis TaxID=176173 RepID=A0ABR4LXT1_9EURO